MNETILVVDDDAAFRELVLDILHPRGYRLLAAADGGEALRLLASEKVDLVLTDQRMPGLDGLELTRRMRATADPPAVVVMTAYGTIPQAVEAVHLGAADYLTKPLESPDALRRTVGRVLGQRDAAPSEPGEFLTRDAAALDVLALADRAAATDATVLVTGESGTGKELLARRLHQRSRRSAGPFVVVNCAAIPENLAESELFGHEKNAFTGAQARHRGRFEQADRGTLFLDEVGELSDAVQAKLLRALEERRIHRVGGSEAVPVDLRLLAATNRDLEKAVHDGSFRRDLYYRLNVVSLRVPPLRERRTDLELLVPTLVEQLAERSGLRPRSLSPETLEILRGHDWPGNVRELRNVLERALIAAPGERIEPPDLPPLATEPGRSEGGDLSLGQMERRAILEALREAGGHRERAARLLGISVRTLYNRLRQYGLR